MTEIAAQVGADRVTFGLNRSDVVWIDGVGAKPVGRPVGRHRLRRGHAHRDVVEHLQADVGDGRIRSDHRRRLVLQPQHDACSRRRRGLGQGPARLRQRPGRRLPARRRHGDPATDDRRPTLRRVRQRVAHSRGNAGPVRLRRRRDHRQLHRQELPGRHGFARQPAAERSGPGEGAGRGRRHHRSGAVARRRARPHRHRQSRRARRFAERPAERRHDDGGPDHRHAADAASRRRERGGDDRGRIRLRHDRGHVHGLSDLRRGDRHAHQLCGRRAGRGRPRLLGREPRRVRRFASEGKRDHSPAGRRRPTSPSTFPTRRSAPSRARR